MKRKIIILMTAILLTSGLNTMNATCQENVSKKRSAISVKKAPVKVNYYVGEVLDLSGLVVTLVIDNDITKDISFSDFASNGLTCTPLNGTRIRENSKTIKITHTASGMTTNQPISLITLKDIDNNTYSLVKIGDQIWMAENLKTTKYNDGTLIPLVTDESEWSDLSSPGYAWFNNDPDTYKDIYGAFYNWFAVKTNMLCPAGWRVPSDAQWSTLISFLGGESVAGGKMKERKIKEDGTEFWANPNVNATNEVGFNGLPGGFRSANDGLFYEENLRGWWWSSNQGINYSINGRIIMIRNEVSSVFVAEANRKNGIYVRCVKN